MIKKEFREKWPNRPVKAFSGRAIWWRDSFFMTIFFLEKKIMNKENHLDDCVNSCCWFLIEKKLFGWSKGDPNLTCIIYMYEMYRNENVMKATNEFFFCFYKFHRRFRESPRNRDMHDDTYTYTFGKYFRDYFRDY